MSITTDHETVDAVARARALHGLVDEQAAASEELGQLTPDIDDALHEQGLYGMWVPKSLGGLELDPITSLEVLEAVSYGAAVRRLGRSWPPACRSAPAPRTSATRRSRRSSPTSTAGRSSPARARGPAPPSRSTAASRSAATGASPPASSTRSTSTRAVVVEEHRRVPHHAWCRSRRPTSSRTRGTCSACAPRGRSTTRCATSSCPTTSRTSASRRSRRAAARSTSSASSRSR